MRFQYNVNPTISSPRSSLQWNFIDHGEERKELNITYQTDDTIEICFPEFLKITVEKERDFATTCAHEISHALTWILYPNFAKDRQTQKEKFTEELITWRIAKTICKSELWDDEVAMNSLKTYAFYWMRGENNLRFFEKKFPINWDKVKIIPWDNKRLNK